MTLYHPLIIFDRNANDVPCLVRVADLMYGRDLPTSSKRPADFLNRWAGAGLSCFNTNSSGQAISIPTATYTLTLPLLKHVGGWDGGPEAIGEDMHMMLKCYFSTHGQLSIRCIPSPASQCNISSGKGGLRGYVHDLRARYTQALRHMWGSLDTGYTLRRWLSLRSSAAHLINIPSPAPVRQKMPTAGSPRARKLSHTDLELKLTQLDAVTSGISSCSTKVSLFTRRNLTLLLRIFEAHFLPAHLTIVILFSSVYAGTSCPDTSTTTTTTYVSNSYLSSTNTSLKQTYPTAITATIITQPSFSQTYLNLTLLLTSYLRLISYLAMILYFTLIYTNLHRVCLQIRHDFLAQSHLINNPTTPSISISRSYALAPRSSRNITTWIDYLIFPIAGMLYGAVPLVHASFAHFLGTSLVYQVSGKGPARGKTGSEAMVTGMEEPWQQEREKYNHNDAVSV